MIYANVYEMDRSYGGPEEGGWYFDIGIAVASFPVPFLDEFWLDGDVSDIADLILAPIREQYPTKSPGTFGSRGSVLGGNEDYSVFFETHTAADFDTYRPWE